MRVKERKKNNKLLLIILILGIILIAFSEAKYIIKVYETRAIESEDFYLESDIASKNGVDIEIEDWNTKIDKEINFSVKNYNNKLVKTDSNIKYNLIVENSSDDINVKILDNSNIEVSENQTLTSDNNNSKDYKLKIHAINEEINQVSFSIKIVSSEPYIETITGNFNLKSIEEKVDANILDYGEYATLEVKSNKNIVKTISFDNDKVLLENVNYELNSDKKSFNISMRTNNIYRIDFIKINSEDIINLNEDIVIE